MLKQGIGLVLLCMASHAFSANIVVTTTEDSDKADNECSLREAIEYVNKGLPEAGYNGCGGKDASNTIYLSSKEYRLNSQITISQSVEIRTQYQSDLNENVSGKKNAVIKMAGKDRIFLIDRSLAPKPPVNTDPNADPNTVVDNPITVSLYEITLDGCGQSQCKDMGGLILNKEQLKINYSQLLNGYAAKGGAIYNAGAYDEKAVLSHVDIRNTLIKGNKANQGGVIYSDLPQYYIEQSLIRENEVTDSNASLFDAQSAFDAEQIKTHTQPDRGIVSSTIFNNKGYIIRVMDAMTINNITMLFNNMGLIINAPLNKAIVANSILAKNGSLDCKVEAGGEASQLSNNLYSAGCEGSASQALGTTNLIASTSNEGKCDLSSDGILCPLADYPEITLAYFKPRLLASYKFRSESPIVNRGPLPQSNLLACSTPDQRGKVRDLNNPELCDRGAIELKVDLSKTGILGQDILYGQIADKMSIADKLQDGELITPEQCEQLFGKNNNGKPWQPGCLKIVQTNTESKGTVTITQDGNVTYVPNGNWHGSDQFNILVVSSTTRFDDPANYYISIETRIAQDPPNNFKDYKVKTSGGSLGLGALFALLGLVGIRRLKK